MKKVNQFVICKDSFKTQEEFENEIKKAVILLLNNDYIMTVKYDAGDKEMGVVVIDYDCADETWGCHYPYWLSPEEFELIESKSEEV